MRGETRIRWRSNDDLTTGHTLSNIIISLTLQDQAHTRQAKRAKTLSSRPLKGTGHAYSWQSHVPIAARNLTREADRKSTRLNSSHEWISYAVFCLKKKIVD